MTRINDDKRAALITRESILLMLSDEEVARVSTAEEAFRLGEGDEYLDLDHLDRGVQLMDGVPQRMGDVLPRKAVRDRTWHEILTHLEARRDA